MTIKTPPGTVPLMRNFRLWQAPEHQGYHAANGCGAKCQHIGFRVVDEKLFDAWLCSQTIRPNVRHVKYEPVSSFEAARKEIES